MYVRTACVSLCLAHASFPFRFVIPKKKVSTDAHSMCTGRGGRGWPSSPSLARQIGIEKSLSVSNDRKGKCKSFLRCEGAGMTATRRVATWTPTSSASCGESGCNPSILVHRLLQNRKAVRRTCSSRRRRYSYCALTVRNVPQR